MVHKYKKFLHEIEDERINWEMTDTGVQTILCKY